MVNGNMVKLENVGAAYVESGNDNVDTDRDVGNIARKSNGNRKS